MEKTIAVENIILIQEKAQINGNGKHNHHCSKSMICIDDGYVTVSMMDMEDAYNIPRGYLSYVMNRDNGVGTYKGKRFCHVAHAASNLEIMTDRIRELSENERKAKLWDDYCAKQEAIRKENEAHEQALDKARAKVERRKRAMENANVKYLTAIDRLAEAERELEDLENIEKMHK